MRIRDQTKTEKGKGKVSRNNFLSFQSILLIDYIELWLIDILMTISFLEE